MLPDTYVKDILVRHAAPCLAGIKPANLVSFTGADSRWCNMYNASLNMQGIYFTPLCACGNRTQILIYRKNLLARFCFQPEVIKALRSFDYQPEKGIEAMIERLQKRMSAVTKEKSSRYKDMFPHEIGFFLGYPVEDVFQYMKMKGQKYLFCGYWKVYSNPERTRKLFRQYTECKEHFALQIKRGMSISDIVCAA